MGHGEELRPGTVRGQERCSRSSSGRPRAEGVMQRLRLGTVKRVQGELLVKVQPRKLSSLEKPGLWMTPPTAAGSHGSLGDKLCVLQRKAPRTEPIPQRAPERNEARTLATGLFTVCFCFCSGCYCALVLPS